MYLKFWGFCEYTPTKTVELKLKDGEKVFNDQGGSQAFVSARFDCIPPVVLRLLAQCLGYGARTYGDENWKKIPQKDHLNHAMNHINEWRAGDRSEPHLVNAMARITFALYQAVDACDQESVYIHPDDKKRSDEIRIDEETIPKYILEALRSLKSFRKVGEWCDPVDSCHSTDGYPDNQSESKGY